MTCEDKGKDWSEEPASPRTQRTACNHQKPGTGKERSSPGIFMESREHDLAEFKLLDS
jgi:hypothetical protein